MEKNLFFVLLSALLMACCGKCGDSPEVQAPVAPVIVLEDVARVFASLPLGDSQMGEVFDAVTSSSDNGYDEEYMMRDLFRVPGSGVGEREFPTKAPAEYALPLRELFRSALEGGSPTKAGGDILRGCSIDGYIAALEDSGIQIYWPYSECWDGSTAPIITYDPEDGSEVNYGWRAGGSGERILVDEQMALQTPIWVINRNDDSGYTSLELLRRLDPAWGSGGGQITVRPSTKAGASAGGHALLLKDMTMKRNYDSWFGGASEFFVKIAAVEDFVASTEAELKLYDPEITDFMVVIRRREVGIPHEFNAVLVSNWTEQLEACALMIIEDDGGSQTSWNCSAVVKVESKSYGFEVSLPLRTRDDIVWRGQLAYKYIMASSGAAGHFGDVDLTFEVVDY